MIVNEKLWDQDTEREFVQWALERVAPEKLFYRLSDGRYIAYYPKDYSGKKETLQSRNALIGEFSETLFRNLIEPIGQERGLYTIQSAICEEPELTSRSPADVVLSHRENNILSPSDIVIIFEVKISIVWNWEYNPRTGELKCICDYRSHTGNPSLLRSDSMLKAIGKCTNIRISSIKASRIPIFVIGNTPVGASYIKKVDNLKMFGIVQGFISLNPYVPEGALRSTPKKGFTTLSNYGELRDLLLKTFDNREEFFSGALNHIELGKIIREASKEKTLEDKAKRFLELLRRYSDG